MIVRKMRPEEIDVTVNLFRYYAAEAGESDPELGAEFDSDSVIDSIRQRNIHPEYVWFNAYDNGRPVGFISACITQAPWNQEIFYAHIELIFMLQSHRNMDNFKRLVEQVEEWARMHNAQKLTAGDIGINVDRTKKIYSHLGFSEGCWMDKELEYV
jgi:GNAT superfamily N-acetyltransferase